MLTLEAVQAALQRYAPSSVRVHGPAGVQLVQVPTNTRKRWASTARAIIESKPSRIDLLDDTGEALATIAADALALASDLQADADTTTGQLVKAVERIFSTTLRTVLVEVTSQQKALLDANTALSQAILVSQREAMKAQAELQRLNIELQQSLLEMTANAVESRLEAAESAAEASNAGAAREERLLKLGEKVLDAVT